MGGGSINTIIAQWFNRRRGLAASLALNGATCGGLLFAPAFAWAIDTLGFAKACMAAVAFVLATLWPLAALRAAPAPAPASMTPATRPTRRARARRRADEPRASCCASRATSPWSAPSRSACWRRSASSPTRSPSSSRRSGSRARAGRSASPRCRRWSAGSRSALVIDRVDRRARQRGRALACRSRRWSCCCRATSLVGLYLGCILFGFGVGNLITLPGLIVQQEFPRRDFARAVSLNVAITQLVAAIGPVRSWACCTTCRATTARR